MGFAFRTAWKFLKSDKKQTLLIIFGMAIGISVQIFVGLLITSLQADLVNETVGNQPHITILPADKTQEIEEHQLLVEEIKKIEGIKNLVPAIDRFSFIMNFSESGNQILLRGLDLENANQMYNFYNDRFIGEKPENMNEIIIGRELAEEYEIEINNALNITPIPGTAGWDLTVTGIFDLGVTNLNTLWIFTNNETIHDLFNPGNNVTSIDMQVEDVFISNELQDKVSSVLGEKMDRLSITNWQITNSDLLGALEAQTLSSVLIQSFVIISVVIAIASVLAITVLQKSKQVGILKAMGADDGKSSRIFLYESFLLGVGGTIVGIAMASFLLWSFTNFALDDAGNPVINIVFNIQFILMSAGISIGASVLSGLIPARKSRSLNIIDIIREG